MSNQKFRLFAGPNGSGKTFFFEHLRSNGVIHTEIYISADKIEVNLKKKAVFNFNAYRVKVSNEEFRNHVLSNGLYETKIKDPRFIENFEIKEGILRIKISKRKINSYHASFIATYLAQKLFATGQSFCFETVMSHISKVFLLSEARINGYKTYLYFVFTDNVELNIARVKLRAKQGEHDVDAAVIRSRYPRTFQLLPRALKLADQAFVVDNSNIPEIVAEKSRSKLKIMDGAKPFIKKYLK